MKYPLHPAARIVFNSRFLVCLLCAGAFALACGPRSPTTAASPPGPASAPRPALATSLDVGVRDGVALVLHVTNTTDQKLELRFPSGQMHDFAILDAQGRELWRASAERMYTQSLQTTLLDPGRRPRTATAGIRRDAPEPSPPSRR